MHTFCDHQGTPHGFTYLVPTTTHHEGCVLGSRYVASHVIVVDGGTGFEGPAVDKPKP